MARNRPRIDGATRAQQRLQTRKDRANAALGWALYTEALNVMADSVELAPVVTSRLRNSVYVTHPSKRGKPRVIFGYGAEYAYNVHEGLLTLVEDLPENAQRAFWAKMSEDGTAPPGWKKSETGGPFFLQIAIDGTASGRKRRIRRTATRFIENGIPQPRSPMPSSEREGRQRSQES